MYISVRNIIKRMLMPCCRFRFHHQIIEARMITLNPCPKIIPSAEISIKRHKLGLEVRNSMLQICGTSSRRPHRCRSKQCSRLMTASIQKEILMTIRTRTDQRKRLTSGSRSEGTRASTAALSLVGQPKMSCWEATSNTCQVPRILTINHSHSLTEPLPMPR